MAQICNHCEDFKNPVTLENGTSLKYPVETQPVDVQFDLYLHDGCAEAWSRAFDIPDAGARDFLKVRLQLPSALPNLLAYAPRDIRVLRRLSQLMKCVNLGAIRVQQHFPRVTVGARSGDRRREITTSYLWLLDCHCGS